MVSNDHDEGLNASIPHPGWFLNQAEYNRLTVAARAVAELRALHVRVERDEPTPYCCRHCLAGHDPRTGEFVYAAWPCQTAKILGEREELTRG